MTETAPPEAATEETEILLTAQDVAKILKVSDQWVYAAAQRDKLPHVKVGRYARFRESQIRQWIEDGGQR